MEVQHWYKIKNKIKVSVLKSALHLHFCFLLNSYMLYNMDISMNIKYVKSRVKSKNQGKNHIQSKRMIFTKTCQN